MLSEIIYAEEKLREAREWRIAASARRRPADPNAEVPRTVGLVHEVFRRIAEGERPARPAARRWLAWR